MAGAWNAHQRPVRQRNTHGLALTSVAIAGWNNATIDASRGDPIAAVGAGAVAEGKRRNHEVALGDVSHLRANGLDYANEFVADRTRFERGLPSVNPEVRTAHACQNDTDNGVGRLADHRVGPVGDVDGTGASKDRCAHDHHSCSCCGRLDRV